MQCNQYRREEDSATDPSEPGHEANSSSDYDCPPQWSGKIGLPISLSSERQDGRCCQKHKAGHNVVNSLI
jgi:hypothetical protein